MGIIIPETKGLIIMPLIGHFFFPIIRKISKILIILKRDMRDSIDNSVYLISPCGNGYLMQGAIMCMQVITSNVVAISEDLKNIDRLEKLLENESESMKMVFQEYVIAKKDPNYFYESHERKDCFVKNLGGLLLNGSLYEIDHGDFTEYDNIVGKIQKEFESDSDNFVSELVVSMCKVFLGFRKTDPKKAWYRMRQLANSCEGDWSK